MFDNQEDEKLNQQIDDITADESSQDTIISPSDADQSWKESQNTAVEPLSATVANITNDLIEIKRQALGQLSPLLKHLDQTPEEKFRTTMMMIQASDDQTMIKSAYSAALSITDDKTRAQALLDVINEINYFTQAAVKD